jgi:hypothetical protein
LSSSGQVTSRRSSSEAPSLRELTIATPGLTHAFVERLRKRFELRRWS